MNMRKCNPGGAILAALLLALWLNINAKAEDKTTLMVAAQNGQTETVKQPSMKESDINGRMLQITRNLDSSERTINAYELGGRK